MEKGRLHRSGKDSKRGRQVGARGARGGGGARGRGAAPHCPLPQTPVLYAMLDHSRSSKGSEKKSRGLGDSRKDKK